MMKTAANKCKINGEVQCKCMLSFQITPGIQGGLFWALARQDDSLSSTLCVQKRAATSASSWHLVRRSGIATRRTITSRRGFSKTWPFLEHVTVMGQD